MKKCIECGSEHSTHWYRGLKCKTCYMKQYRIDNHDRIYERNRTPKYRFSNARKSALERGKEWKLSLDEFMSVCDEPCFYCSNELGPIENYGGGLDRLDNSFGYELANVVPCCKVCNLIRNTHLSVEETKIAVEAIIAYRKSRVAL